MPRFPPTTKGSWPGSSNPHTSGNSNPQSAPPTTPRHNRARRCRTTTEMPCPKTNGVPTSARALKGSTNKNTNTRAQRSLQLMPNPTSTTGFPADASPFSRPPLVLMPVPMRPTTNRVARRTPPETGRLRPSHRHGAAPFSNGNPITPASSPPSIQPQIPRTPTGGMLTSPGNRRPCPVTSQACPERVTPGPARTSKAGRVASRPRPNPTTKTAPSLAGSPAIPVASPWGNPASARHVPGAGEPPSRCRQSPVAPPTPFTQKARARFEPRPARPSPLATGRNL